MQLFLYNVRFYGVYGAQKLALCNLQNTHIFTFCCDCHYSSAARYVTFLRRHITTTRRTDTCCPRDRRSSTTCLCNHLRLQPARDSLHRQTFFVKINFNIPFSTSFPYTLLTKDNFSFINVHPFYIKFQMPYTRDQSPSW